MPFFSTGASASGGDTKSVVLHNAQAVPVSALRFAVPALDSREKAQSWLYTADSKGSLRCWDLSVLFSRHGDSLKEKYGAQI